MLIRKSFCPWNQRRLAILSGFSHDYGDRIEARLVLSQLPKRFVIKGKSTRSDYWSQHGKVAFVAAPFGHGLDTHRLWEALTLKTVPIVCSSSMDSLYSLFPVAIIPSWSYLLESSDKSENMLLSLREDIVTRFGEDPFSNPEVIEMLTSEFWINKIRQKASTTNQTKVN